MKRLNQRKEKATFAAWPENSKSLPKYKAVIINRIKAC